WIFISTTSLQEGLPCAAGRYLAWRLTAACERNKWWRLWRLSPAKEGPCVNLCTLGVPPNVVRARQGQGDGGGASRPGLTARRDHPCRWRADRPGVREHA